MQERYLGDSHDYVKYALLRHLHSSLQVTIGLNWYFTKRTVDHPDNNDGEQRSHLNGDAWKHWDDELFRRIKFFAHPEHRRIFNIKGQKILPKGTLFYETTVPLEDRSIWHKGGMDALSGAGLVFLDPNIGFEVKSATRKSLPKYALYGEACDYYRQGKIVVAIQFAQQCDPVRKANDVREKLYRQAKFSGNIPVLRARIRPNILFLFLFPDTLNPQHMTKALCEFVNKSEGRSELIL